MINLKSDYTETELKSENPLFRKWSNNDGSVWYTDKNNNYLGDDLAEAEETHNLNKIKK